MMIARLILTLLLALAALPAGATMPACHAAMPGMTTDALPTKPTRHEAPAAVDHGCIGCAALADWLTPRVTPPLFVPAAPTLPQPIRFILGDVSPPALPPPRIG